jgi:outer membrane protein OmpA-like peptidoglycan-associated protein
VEEILRREGIRSAAADLRCLDLHVAGDAGDLPTLERTTAALRALSPVRLVSNDISIASSLQGDLQAQVLKLRGWLPTEADLARVVARIGQLRPDIRVDAAEVAASPQVRWPEQSGDPLSDNGVLLAGILKELKLQPSLRIEPRDGQIVVSGALPNATAKDAIVNALRDTVPKRFAIDASSLAINSYIAAADFAQAGALSPFLHSFYGTPSPGDFTIGAQGRPHLRANATPTLQTEWLALLRPATGGAKVEMDVKLYPSIYHFPDYACQTPLPPQTLEALRQSLSDFYLVFSPVSSGLSPSARARLAGLASTFLEAGPSLQLIVGGHPDSGGDLTTQKRIALARAEEVRSFLVEQGCPAQMEALAFDPLPPGSADAQMPKHSVEILIK